ncbi:hypothetical protein M408DRAFT_121946 [Serendipita vermifera MAFF 305830]|uniref:F-box domain-containing protein n=1 Tax=Serendipita vermifera MAFF 305830 TaxID=933852 RepID=A0A0C2XJR3_SERVB|nr:hypothetical protein M408DRAFT_121946 [Serendipita vermifera MAFF 305830]
MWTPADPDALPSQSEIEHTREAIQQLQNAIQDILEQARLRIVPLEKEIAARQGWIAPVRKLPVEILTEIFLYSRAVSELSPVTISEVCRLWRRVILATPQAWTLIYLRTEEHDRDDTQYLTTFIERSDPYPLHLWTPMDRFTIMEDSDDSGSSWVERDAPFPLSRLVVSHRNRITCLSIRGEELDKYMRKSFPNLTSLFVVDQAESPLFFTRDRFPRLTYLHAWYCGLRPGPVGTQYSPLQYLFIYTNDEEEENSDDWLRILEACSATLKGLAIRGQLFEEPPTFTTEIRFPMLTYLFVDEFLDSRNSVTALPTFYAIAPNLVSYETLIKVNSTVALHDNVRNVQYLRASIFSDIAIYSSLRIFQLPLVNDESEDTWVLDAPSPTLTTLLDLLMDSNTCPLLESIDILENVDLLREEYGESLYEWHQRSIRAFEDRLYDHRPLVTVRSVTKLSDLPGSLESVRCNAEMPCQRIPRAYV